MLNKNDFAEVYETLLSSPGMLETIKIDLRISRKNALLLAQLLQRSLNLKGNEDSQSIPEVVPNEAVEDLMIIVNDVLEKGGLTELNSKLKKLSSK